VCQNTKANWKGVRPRRGERLSCYELYNQITFAADMKKMFVLSMLISFAMICSCQKQDSAAEQQLAQRKTDLDAREEALAERKSALDEREKALGEREKSLAQREKAIANIRTIPSGIQGQTPDPEQAKAERDSRLQQLPPELRTLIPPPSQVTAGDPAKQARRAPRQLGPEELQRQWEGKLNKAKMSGEAVSPAAEAGSPTSSPAVEATSRSPSPTPE
jgi:TolA-binding protein